jgi:multidrug resistance efflux pump
MLQGASALAAVERTVAWIVALAGVAALLSLDMQDRASAPCQLRSAARVELRAPVAGFLQTVYFDEGDRVSPGALVALMEVPDLASRVAQKKAEVREAQATLTLLEAGTRPRPEEIQAKRAHLDRLREEARYLEELSSKVPVCAPVAGLITTPRLKEKVGQYVKEGELICLVEEPADLVAEIALAEQDVVRVAAGQKVELKVRALPFETLSAEVERIAPRGQSKGPQELAKDAGTRAAPGEEPVTITVYCRLKESRPELRPGLSGYARIYTGPRSIGGFLADRVLRFLRTEFWW